MRTIIIAEAGVNHNGDLGIALKMIEAAKEAGADYIKFQTFVPELLISGIAPKAEYQKANTAPGQSQLDMCRGLSLPLEDFAYLSKVCSERGIGFLSTPFDMVSIDRLKTLDMDYWKIPSGEITNLPYLRKIAGIGGKIILSTGMSTLGEVSDAVKALNDGGIPKGDITLLHCTTQYPTPMEAVNLRAMLTLRDLECGAIGYSDHTLGIEIPIAAVAMGARVIEKHFTLDRSMQGPDHRASLMPDELAAMTRCIRNVERAIGDGAKVVADAERPNINVARKSIVAARDIRRGEIFSDDNITVKRPGNGISPMRWDEVIGQTAKRDFAYDTLIEL